MVPRFTISCAFKRRCASCGLKQLELSYNTNMLHLSFSIASNLVQLLLNRLFALMTSIALIVALDNAATCMQPLAVTIDTNILTPTDLARRFLAQGAMANGTRLGELLGSARRALCETAVAAYVKTVTISTHTVTNVARVAIPRLATRVAKCDLTFHASKHPAAFRAGYLTALAATVDRSRPTRGSTDRHVAIVTRNKASTVRRIPVVAQVTVGVLFMALVAVIFVTDQASTLAGSSLAFEHCHSAAFTVNHVSASLAKRLTTGIARFNDSTIRTAVMTTHTAVRTMTH